jgi:hypothetical protein
MRALSRFVKVFCSLEYVIDRDYIWNSVTGLMGKMNANEEAIKSTLIIRAH